MPTLTINGEIIDFPESAQSPNWSEAIIQFAEAVEAALSITSGTYDVAPQTMNIDAYNTASNVSISNLSFPTSNVRAAFIRYSVYRATSAANGDEAGTMVVVYNANNATNEKWTLTQDRTGNGASITFSITDTGQLRFTTTALAGTSHVGTITYEARALEQS